MASKKENLLTAEQRDIMIDRIRQFFWEERGEELGNIGSDIILDFFIAQLGPMLSATVIEQYKERLHIKLEDTEAEIIGGIRFGGK